MARPLRLHYPGGFYHVTLRGNHRQPIFRVPSDRDTLNRIVAEVIGDRAARLHAYCWMTNHIHMLVQISDIPLGRIMLPIASRYARIFQMRIETTGHLFERRYHSVLVDAERYLLTLVRYIHLNPVRAGLVADPASHPWSSHHDYAYAARTPWVHTSHVLRMLSAADDHAIQAYFDWMKAGDGDRWGEGELVTNAGNCQVLGDDAFVTRLAGSSAPDRTPETLQQLLSECAVRFNVDARTIASVSRSHALSRARAWFSIEGTRRGIATTSAVARFLGRDESAVRRLIQRHASRKP